MEAGDAAMLVPEGAAAPVVVVLIVEVAVAVGESGLLIVTSTGTFTWC